MLHEVARRVLADRPLVAEMLTREMGKPFKESADEVSGLRAPSTTTPKSRVMRTARFSGPSVDGQFHFTTKDPLGRGRDHPAVQLSAVSSVWQAAAALASGNAVIVKPSELTSLTTLQFIQAFDALPRGLVQVITRCRAARANTWSSTPKPTWWRSRAESRPVDAIAEVCGRLYKRSADRDLGQ